ncbi:isoleucine--tRNA ligase, partial [Myxococcota bacterium]|nr:isoleucine--tRNA ligase [Myxococcota bacterium]
MSDYKQSLNLPETAFEMRAGLAKKEPALLEKWNERQLYEEIQKSREGAPSFVLHDGPPYANGHLHQGTILNKILKDIVVKDRTMAGFQTAYIPGWDCHGLPIELKVDQKLGKKKSSMSKSEIRKECRTYAGGFVDIQREEFKRLGVLGRWEDPYLTMSHAYESQIVRELSKFAEADLLYKGLRPVNWCIKCETALAEAEVEYEDHDSPSIYVAFEMLKKPSNWDNDLPLDLVIWTTTPWTLPANLAVSVQPDFDYVAYPIAGRHRIIAQGLLDSVLKTLGEDEFDDTKIAKKWKGEELEHLSYQHPLFEKTCPVIVGRHVTLEAGTGCVHTAPGHGPDDFIIGKRYDLDVLSPVNSWGKFTADAERFEGLNIFKANPQIVEELHTKGALLNKKDEVLNHRYPTCWRCHRPIILRATEQWWVSMDKPYNDGPTLRERALSTLDEVEWVPSRGQGRIKGMLEGRPDWCLSRQRTWGVPIPAFYCDDCNEPVLEPKTLLKIADIFEEKTSDAWFDLSVEELAGDLKCKKCGGTHFSKEKDILDVWFDSGVSFAATILKEGLGHPEGAPVDLYLEGSDQHRGWF